MVLRMTASARRLTWFAGAVVGLASVAIWIFARNQDTGLQPPDPVPTPLATVVLLGLPGLIGWIGALTGRRSVVVAAGVLCLFQSVIAFSGVTLVYLVPAIAFLRASTLSSQPSGRRPIRPLRLLVAIVIAIPIALVLVLNLGILAVLALALVAGLAASRGQRQVAMDVSGIEAARGLAIVLAVIGAWAAVLALTEATCWIARSATDGGLIWERIPVTNSITMGPGDVASSCSSGVPTPTGLEFGALLLVVALIVAAVPLRGPGVGRTLTGS
jgi:hypothetical protein